MHSIDDPGWRERSGRPAPSWAAWGFIVFAFTYYSQAFLTAFHADQSTDIGLQVGKSDVISTAWQACILAGLVVLFVRDPGWLLRHAGKMKLYFAICALCILSTLWSLSPGITIRRSVTFTECILFSIYAYDTLGLGGMIRLVGRMGLFFAVSSVAVYIAIPSVGREIAIGYTDAMRGVFSQKNPMAECMVLTITCFCYRMIVERRLGWRNPLVILFLFGCILLGRSASSALVAMLVFLATAFMLLDGHRTLRRALLLLVAWAVMALVTLAVLAPDAIFAGIGRDASLTGRVPLWVEVMHAMWHRPLLGYGYAGFFNAESRETQWLWLIAGWEAPDAHDGYMDIVIQIGLVGLVLYLWLWGRVIVRAWRHAADPDTPMAKWILLAMLVNVTVNLDEGPLPFADWFTMMLPPAVLSVAYWHEREVLARIRRFRQPAPRLLDLVRSAG